MESTPIEAYDLKYPKQLPAPATLVNDFGDRYEQVIQILLTQKGDDLSKFFRVDEDVLKCPDIKALQTLCRDETLENCVIDSYVKVIHNDSSLAIGGSLNIVNLCESEKIQKSSTKHDFDPKNECPTYMIMRITVDGNEHSIGHFGGVLFYLKHAFS